MHHFLPATLFATLFSLTTSAVSQVGGADYDTQYWTESRQNSECSLNYQIPGLGNASFKQAAGELSHFELQFLKTKQPISRSGKILQQAQVWQKNTNKTLMHFTLLRSNQVLGLGNKHSQALLKVLQNGYGIDFVFDGVKNQPAEYFAISSLRFNSSFAQFNACLAQLPKHSFAELRKSAVYFDSGSARLSAPGKSWLNDICLFAKEDEVTALELSGMADKVGTHEANFILARNRGEAVKVYCISKGVPVAKISLKVLGNTSSINDNRTEQGRANNRQVSIKLVR